MTAEEAIEIATEFLRNRKTPAHRFARSTFGRHPDERTGEIRPEWNIAFEFVEEPYCHMDPGEVWVIVDAETREARLFPML